MAKTIPDWLAEAAAAHSQSTAITGIYQQPALTYQALWRHVQTTAAQLYAIGLQPGDPVVVALSNGPACLTAILSVAAAATAFPLNPDQPEAEFKRYFSSLNIKAVVVDLSARSAAIAVAQQLGIPILAIATEATAPAGAFMLSEPSAAASQTIVNKPRQPQLSDCAILVGTSGSTGRPKIVSLTHESFFVSISHAANWMQLTKCDRSLVLTPMAMLHALVRSSCPLLLKGGEVVCTPGYSPAHILDWIDQFQPTFFTGVPSIYRSLLQQIKASSISKVSWRPPKSLRFLVTGSDKIDASEINAVEKALAVPLIQFYGMSEVSPLPAVRSLPPAKTPAAAVGKVNPMWQVACVNEQGDQLLANQEGEIVLKGGYINQLITEPSDVSGKVLGKQGDRSDQNGCDGWFHTGDLGYLDSEGFLYYTGRIDNRINHGGKKVYAGDVEAALLCHLEIEAATVFGIPDRLYGERVGAAVVLTLGSKATAQSIRRFMLDRVEMFKIPSKIIICPSLPLNAFGKVQRKSLAAHFGLGNCP